MVQSSGELRLGGAPGGTGDNAPPLAQAAAATALKRGKYNKYLEFRMTALVIAQKAYQV